MKELAKSYITKRIEQATTPEGNLVANFQRIQYPSASRDLLARQEALGGFIDSTASHLVADDRLPLNAKSAILAAAYNRRANLLTHGTELNTSKEEERLRRIAKWLVRAGRRVRNS